MAATKGLKDYLFMAACEWFLMFWIFIDAALAYSLTKFAKKCQLQIPCLLCSRLDHFFENEERGSYSCLHLFCNKHQGDISNLIYCDLHNELVDIREMCEDCFNSATLQNQSNFRRSYLNKNLVGVSCSCCKRQWKEKPFGQGSIQPNSVGSRVSKPTTKPPLPRVARHGRPKRTRYRVKQRHKDASFPIGYPELKFTSDSEFEFLFSDDDGGGTFKVAGISERNSRDDTNSGNRYKILGRRTYSTPDLTSASLQHNNNSRTRTRIRTRSASLTPNCLTRHSLAELNRKTKGKKQLSSMSSTRLWVDSLNKANGHGSFGGSTMSCSSGSQNRYKTFSRNSYSASDLGSALLLEMHYNKSLPRRSASLTPNCLSWYGLAGLEQKFEESDSFKATMDKKPSSSRNSTCLSVPLSYADGHGSLDGSMVACSSGSQNRYNIFSRNSFSVSDLGSALLLEMHNNKSLPRRAASLTPNSSAGHGLGEFRYPMKVVPPNVRKNKKSVLSSNVRSGVSTAFGHLDDSVISRKTGSHHNHNTIPRRHSYSVFQLGGDILLNMPTDESFTSSAFLDPYGSLSAMQFPVEKGEKDHQQLPPSSSINRLGSSSDFRSDLSNAFINKSKEYGFLDDSVVSRSTGIQYQNNMPRRHSYSFFELGCEVLLNMPYNESLASHSAYSTPNDPVGFGFGEPNNLNFQIRSSPSHNVMQIPHQKAKKDKKSLPSSNRGYGYKSSDDFYVSRKTNSSHNINKNPRRHSYSAFELGCAYLLDMPPFDECLTNRSASLTPNVSSDSIDLGSLNALQFPLQMDFLRSLDDSVVSRNTGNHIHNQNRIPRRHSYSVFQLGGDILLNMPIDESLTSHSASLAPNHSTSYSLKDPQTSKFQKGEKDKKSLPPMSSIKSHSSSSGVTSDLSIDKTKWHGSFDDYLVSRSVANQNQNNVPRRHSVSAFDLGQALIVEVQVDNSLRNMHASLAPISSTEHSLGDLHQAHNHHHRAKRDKKLLPPLIPMNGLGSSSDVRSDLFTISFNKTHGVHSLDGSFYSHNKDSHNQNSNPRRHSYSAFEFGCALMLNMQCDGNSRRRSASVTPKIQTNTSVPRSLDIGSLHSMQFIHKVKESHSLQSKKDKQPLQSTNSIRSDLPSTSIHKPHEYGSYDDSFLSHDKDSRKLYTNLTRNSYSTSDLTSPVLLQTNPNESFTFKSASLTPSCSTSQGLGELNLLTFQTGPSSSLQKHKKSERPKAKKCKKLLSSANNVNMMSSSTNTEGILLTDSVDKTDRNESFDHSAVSNDMGGQNRYKTFSRNSQSASDLGSLQLLEIHHDGNSRSRSKSLTPDCYSRSLQPDSLNSVQYHINKPEEYYHPEVEKDKKPLPVMQPTKETTSTTNIKSDLCPGCLDKIDLRSLDGSTYSEIEYEGLEKVKRQAEDDVRCMRLLQSELEAERNAATVAANNAMNMITRLQQEKASLQMEALQYLRMMEEQAEYDMEALQKANELVEEKENEIQDLLDELEEYRSKYGDESLNNIKSFEDEKKYILESLSAIEKKIHQLSSGVTNKEKLESDHLNAENSLSTHNDSLISNGVLDKSQENESHVETSKQMVSKDGEVDIATLEHEILDLKQKMGALQADLDLLKHACNTLRGSEGLEFIQDIAHQLQDLRKYIR